MKTSTFLPAFALAFTAVAVETPTKVERDVATVSSIVSQVSDAISNLDKSVNAFTSDATQIQADADKLASIIKSGVTSIDASAELSIADTTELQDTVKALGNIGTSLINDVTSKRSAFESAQLCTTVQTVLKDVGSEAQTLIDGVIKKVPEEVQQLAQQFAGSFTDTLSKGTAAFASDQCKSGSAASGQASSASAFAKPAFPSVPVNPVARDLNSQATVTVTVTAPCSGAPKTSAPVASVPVVTPATITSSAASRTPSLGLNSTYIPTGGFSTSAFPPIATAGAAIHAVGPAGVLAGVAAALFL
ncbi:hydrophobic surface binding protein A-domain-containing protein [Whalleya microplaca]|nr:hydrophobic surface binding protein A-domain-containing protein [Whalleya microplaca]